MKTRSHEDHELHCAGEAAAAADPAGQFLAAVLAGLGAFGSPSGVHRLGGGNVHGSRRRRSLKAAAMAAAMAAAARPFVTRTV